MKKRGKSQTKAEPITIEVPDAIYDRIAALARRDGRTIKEVANEVANRAVRHWLRGHLEAKQLLAEGAHGRAH